MKIKIRTRVVDPDPEDLYVFGPPGSASGSVSHKYPDPVPDPLVGGTDPDPSIIKQK